MDHSWRGDAQCVQYDPDSWFPANRRAREARQAVQICASCMVRLKCLHEAIVLDERFGIWGGLDVDERDAFRKRVQRA